MSKTSFIKRILSLGRSGGDAEPAAGAEGPVADSVVEASRSGEAALRPSITEILFRRSDVAAGNAPAGEAEADLPERAGERRLTRKEETAQKISEGFESMSGLLRSIGEKLETGNERGRALAESIEELPEVLRSIPETSRAQIEFLGTISKQLDLQTTRAGELTEYFRQVPEILASIPESQAQQVEQLREIATLLTRSSSKQLEFVRGVQRAQTATVTAFQNAQNKSLNLFHKAQQRSLSMFKGAQTNQARQMREFIDRTQRSLSRVLVACATIVGAAVVAVAAMYLLR